MTGTPTERMTNEDRRGHPRYDILAQIRVKRGTVVYLMDVSNISASGAFVATESIGTLPWFRVGLELDLDLFTTEDLDNVRVKGRIVRLVDRAAAGGKGFGVEFFGLDEQNHRKLRLMLERAAEKSIHPPPLPALR